MLDADTKRRIDTARDVLVGKVPDPKSQVEQITIALIYKFMDDIDAQSEEWGGKRKFFAGDFARYGWARLLHHGLGGHEILNLYAEAIDRMPQNPGIPPLFRDIFENAYLPYRDPQTLRTFLEIIDEFSYDHSERLGDAFEYLLSVLGSQGDAGQFRTPRHIIDFIVAVIDPKKDETLLDPACGTAGFLISSYKHVLANNADDHGNSTLTPDEKARLAANVKGYDISPDMVRLSLVNMYLHDFVDPHIFEYDTLTSEERWHEYADVILANPPFMSPKGGIRPHNRFSVKSKRSEVLFVDYMAEHLTPSGRAGIIVPEGIIFQSQSAYKQLRRMLLEDYLVAVVSLPAGVFQPYSGVKTSILILDRSLAKRSNHVGFFKVENDGFDLGAQRRPIESNDLPQAREEIIDYLRHLRSGEPLNDFHPTLGLVVEKEKISANSNYNLSGERYRENTREPTPYTWAKIGHLIKTVTAPVKIQKTAFAEVGRFPIMDQSQKEIAGWTNDESAVIQPIKPFVIFGDHTCTVKLIESSFAQGADGIKILSTVETLDPRFLYYILRVKPLENKGYQRHFSRLKDYEIPLPPLQVQQEIVAEIEGYQKVIDGARTVVDHYRPHIPIDPDWPMVALGDVISLEYGKPLKSENRIEGPFAVFGSNGVIGYHDQYLVGEPTIIVGRKGSAGAVNYCDLPCYPIDTTFFVQIRDRKRLDIRFCYYQLLALELEKVNVQAGVPGLNRNDAYRKPLALPPLEIQQAIVVEIEAEQAIVANCRDLIDRFEGKIRKTIARVWGNDSFLA